MQVTKVQEEYNNQMEAYNRGQRTTVLKVFVSRWLQAAYRARIVSWFPELDIGADSKSLVFTLEEIT